MTMTKSFETKRDDTKRVLGKIFLYIAEEIQKCKSDEVDVTVMVNPIE